MEKKLIYILVISGSLLVLLLVLHAAYKSDEFASPRQLNIISLDSGYTARTHLIQGKEYGIVVAATMHRDNLVKFRNIISLKIDSIDTNLIKTNYIIGNNTYIDSGWVNKSKKILFQKEYLRKFTSPVTCDECLLYIQGHSPTFLKDYKFELHENIDETYYWLGYTLALVAMSFIVTALFSIIYVFIHAIKKRSMQMKSE